MKNQIETMTKILNEIQSCDFEMFNNDTFNEHVDNIENEIETLIEMMKRISRENDFVFVHVTYNELNFENHEHDVLFDDIDNFCEMFNKFAFKSSTHVNYDFIEYDDMQNFTQRQRYYIADYFNIDDEHTTTCAIKCVYERGFFPRDMIFDLFIATIRRMIVRSLTCNRSIIQINLNVDIRDIDEFVDISNNDN